jgi:N-acetyl-anhydromuramyl-L-alanine amidase AmpD
MRKVNWIVIHQSASRLKQHDNIETIRKWHLERGFKDIGYHYYINMDGKVFKGRSEDKEGAHVKGHNKGSLGICLGGEGEKTPAQLNALEVLLIDLCSRHELEKKDILAHADLAATECPGFDLHGWLATRKWH